MCLAAIQVGPPLLTSQGWEGVPTVGNETPSVEVPTGAVTTMPITAEGSSCRFNNRRISINKLMDKSGSDVELVGIRLFAGRAQVTKTSLPVMTRGINLNIFLARMSSVPEFREVAEVMFTAAKAIRTARHR